MRRYLRILGILCLVLFLACGVPAEPTGNGTDGECSPEVSRNGAEPSPDTQTTPKGPTHEEPGNDQIEEAHTPEPADDRAPSDEDESLPVDEPSPSAIEAALMACWAAYNARDWDLYLSYCTGYHDPGLFLLQSQVTREMSGEITVKSIGDIEIDGTTATALVVASSKQGTQSSLRTLEYDDGWKVVADHL